MSVTDILTIVVLFSDGCPLSLAYEDRNCHFIPILYSPYKLSQNNNLLP